MRPVLSIEKIDPIPLLEGFSDLFLDRYLLLLILLLLLLSRISVPSPKLLVQQCVEVDNSVLVLS